MTNIYYKYEITINAARKGSIKIKATSSETADEVAMKIVKTAYKCNDLDTILLSLTELEEK